jgi:hypothetical protein
MTAAIYVHQDRQSQESDMKLNRAGSQPSMTGQPEQLGFHTNRAMHNGLIATEAGEIVRQLAYYTGWPRAMSAVPVLGKILADRKSR